MARAAGSKQSAPVAFVFGEDDFGVKSRAREIFRKWSDEIGGFDHETIDASAANSGEALAAIRRLKEALQTLPFFGSGKVVWFKDCNFLADDRTASAQAVTEAVNGLAQSLKEFQWQNVRLVISAGKVDKRKSFYKTVEKLAATESFNGWAAESKGWEREAEEAARRQFQKLNKRASPDAVARLVAYVGPNSAQLFNEVEKAALYVGDADSVTAGDIDIIAQRNKQSRAFALGDALGDRNLPRVMKALDEALWEAKSSRGEIGLLYLLISKVRSMILARELAAAGWVRSGIDYDAFRTALASIPPDALPEDRRFNPLSINSYVLFRASQQARNYETHELVAAMQQLLDCNIQLISSTLEPGLLLQQTLAKIVRRSG